MFEMFDLRIIINMSYIMIINMKSVKIRSFFWFVFSPNARKYGPEKTPYLDTFYAVKNPWTFKANKKNAITFKPFLTNIPLTDNPGSWLLLAKCLKYTSGRVTLIVKMQVIDLHLYQNRHSSTGVFQTFCQYKPTTWFLH